MRRGEKRRALGDQGVHRGIPVVGPKNNFDPPPFSFGTKAVVLFGRRKRCNSKGKAIEFELDMAGFAGRRGPKRFNKTELRIERHRPRQIARIKRFISGNLKVGIVVPQPCIVYSDYTVIGSSAGATRRYSHSMVPGGFDVTS